MKPTKRAFYIMLAALAGILIIFGVCRSIYGQFLPDMADKAVPDIIMFAAVGILLWNRKVIGDAEKAAKAAEAESQQLKAEEAKAQEKTDDAE
jgi:hypothetical protein